MTIYNNLFNTYLFFFLSSIYLSIYIYTYAHTHTHTPQCRNLINERLRSFVEYFHQINDDGIDRYILDFVEPRKTSQRKGHFGVLVGNLGGHLNARHNTGYSGSTVLGRRRDIFRIFLRHRRLLHLVPRRFWFENVERRGTITSKSTREI